jgi:hypothetical protein
MVLGAASWLLLPVYTGFTIKLFGITIASVRYETN